MERERVDPDPQRRPGGRRHDAHSGRPGGHEPRGDGCRREHQGGRPEAPLGGRIGDVAVAGAGPRAAEAAGVERLGAAAGVVHQGQHQGHHLQPECADAGQQAAPDHHPARFLGLPDPVQARLRRQAGG